MNVLPRFLGRSGDGAPRASCFLCGHGARLNPTLTAQCQRVCLRVPWLRHIFKLGGSARRDPSIEREPRPAGIEPAYRRTTSRAESNGFSVSFRFAHRLYLLSYGLGSLICIFSAKVQITKPFPRRRRSTPPAPVLFIYAGSPRSRRQRSPRARPAGSRLRCPN